MNKRLKFNGFPIKTSRQSGILQNIINLHSIMSCKVQNELVFTLHSCTLCGVYFFPLYQINQINLSCKRERVGIQLLSNTTIPILFFLLQVVTRRRNILESRTNCYKNLASQLNARSTNKAKDNRNSSSSNREVLSLLFYKNL